MYKFLIFITIIIFISIKYYNTIVFSIHFFNSYKVYILSLFFFISILYKWLRKKGTYENTFLDLLLIQEKNSKQNINSKCIEKRNVSATTKKIVASNQKWLCGMCNNMMDYTYEIDHRIPLFKGGTNDINNLMALCRNCHGKKTILEKIIS